MRLAILGGGGFRVPLVFEAVATGATGLAVDELALHDVDEARLRVIERVVDELGAELVATGRASAPLPRVIAATDLREALTGADFVFSAVRVGGAQGRTVDERVALDLGLLGQETVGPGGLAYALRTIPEALAIARTIAEVAPDAWTITFTNPAGIVTEAMREVLGDRVVGICDTPIGLVRRAGRLLGIDPTAIDEAGEAAVGIDYVGVNHLGWLRCLTVDGEDRLREILDDDAALAAIEEARVVGPDVVRAMAALPNEYLYYYLRTDEAIARIAGAGRTRGEFLLAQQGAFYEAAGAADSALAVWRATLHEREATYMAEARDEERQEEDIAGGGYQEVALRLMTAIATGRPARMILDVGNAPAASAGAPEDRAVPELPADMVLELPCRVDADGVHPERVGPLALEQLGMMAALRASEREILAAATTGSRRRARHGFAIHPLVRSASAGAALLDGYEAGHPEIAALLGGSAADSAGGAAGGSAV